MKNKNLIYVLLTVVIALVAYLAITSLGSRSNQQISAQSQFQPILTGTTEQGDVSIELTPINMDNKRLEVTIAANTHSIDLSQFNLEELTTLEYNGKAIKPSSFPSLSGHHSSGILVFDTDNKVTSFTIKIKGIPKIQERTFEWK